MKAMESSSFRKTGKLEPPFNGGLNLGKRGKKRDGEMRYGVDLLRFWDGKGTHQLYLHILFNTYQRL
jgi:hypothetical protein